MCETSHITKKNVAKHLASLVSSLRTLFKNSGPEGGLLMADFQVQKPKMLPDFVKSLSATLTANFGESIRAVLVPHPREGCLECYFGTNDKVIEFVATTLKEHCGAEEVK